LSFKGSGLSLSSKFLDLILEVLLSLSVGSDLRFFNDTLLDKSVFWLKLSKRVFVTVDKTESSGSITTELGSETEDNNLFQRSVVLLGDLLLEVFFGADGGVFMDDIDDHLGSV
jgi:hypothetical protein